MIFDLLIVVSVFVSLNELSEVYAVSVTRNLKEKRSLYWPYNSGIALAVALAVPIDNGRGDVFVSYCVETNFNSPTYDQTGQLDPPLFTTINEAENEGNRNIDTKDYDFIDEPNINKGTENKTVEKNENEITSKDSKINKKSKAKRKMEKSKNKSRRIRNSFLSRRKFFRMIENKLFQYGFNAKQCLLKAICETAQHRYGEHNGLLGDLVHVMFSPTTSKNENLPKKYYIAEQNGYLGLCEMNYGEECPTGLFDLINLIK